MKTFLFLVVTVLSSAVYAAPTCTVDDARNQLYTRISSILDDIESYFGMPMCKNSQEAEKAEADTWSPECVSINAVIKAVNNVQWNEEEEIYKTPDFLNWQCAPSVQCWAWIQTDCKGNYDVLNAGED